MPNTIVENKDKSFAIILIISQDHGYLHHDLRQLCQKKDGNISKTFPVSHHSTSHDKVSAKAKKK